MNYEKAYNEALQLARTYYDKGTNEFLDTIFPELRDIEDERIRKAIKCYVEDMPDTYGFAHGIGKKEMLSYLEKQKINTDGDFGRGYNCGYECCLNSHGAEWFEKQKELTAQIVPGYPGHYFYDGNKLHLCSSPAMEEKQKEQKPAEWSEEDKKRIKQLIYDTEHIRAEYEKRKKELGESFNDELIKDCDEQIAWLKSLCPHWKPSEEQMDALLKAEKCLNARKQYGSAKRVAEIYKHFKDGEDISHMSGRK